MAKKRSDQVELNDRQKRFCLLYTANPNATAAYEEAYNSAHSTAQQNGRKLLTLPHIKAELRRLSKKYLAEKEEMIFRWVKRVEQMAHGSILDIIDDINTARGVVYKSLDKLDPAVVKNVKNKYDREGNVIGVEIDAHDNIKALEQLGRYLSVFRDQLDIDMHDTRAEEAWKLREEERKKGQLDDGQSTAG